MRLPLLVGTLAAFVGVSVYLVHAQPFFGFLSLAISDPWGGQIFLDLVIALSLFLSWAKRDARERGLPYLPYLVATVALGSMGALAYLIHREIVGVRRAVTATTPGPQRPGPAG